MEAKAHSSNEKLNG
jgi:hypothetical protein